MRRSRTPELHVNELLNLMNGYTHEAYAASLSQFGTPRFLSEAGGWVLERPIDGFPYRDAMGCYPLFSCADWSKLELAVNEIQDDLVSLSIVTDPFGNYDLDTLRKSFPDLVIPFKQHYVTDLRRPLDEFVDPHHRRNVLKSQREVQVEKSADPSSLLDEWLSLYETLIARHNITGIRAFSRSSFEKQLKVPGIVAFRAIHESCTVGMLLWYEQIDRAYYHLGAYNQIGYELGASFALFDFALRHFASLRTKWLSLGAGAGLESKSESGLDRFKRGWSTGTQPVYFCGRIVNSDRYQEVVRAKQLPPTDYFPAYRTNEFN